RVMLAIALFAVPLALAALAAFGPPRWRPYLVPIGGAAHLALTAAALWLGPAPGSVARATELFGLRIPVAAAPEIRAANGWLGLDPLGRLVLPLLSVLFFVCSLYVPAYLAERRNRPDRMFCTALLMFLAMMTLMTE